jgi:hypothetical protein
MAVIVGSHGQLDTNKEASYDVAKSSIVASDFAVNFALISNRNLKRPFTRSTKYLMLLKI